MANNRRLQLIRWSVFAVLVALLPFGLQLLFAWTKGQALSWESFCQTCKDGDLLLTAAALAADALGDVIARRAGEVRLLCGGGSFLLAATASAWYGQIRTGGGMSTLTVVMEHAAQQRICEGSLAILVMTLILAVVIKLL